MKWDEMREEEKTGLAGEEDWALKAEGVKFGAGAAGARGEEEELQGKIVAAQAVWLLASQTEWRVQQQWTRVAVGVACGSRYGSRLIAASSMNLMQQTGLSARERGGRKTKTGKFRQQRKKPTSASAGKCQPDRGERSARLC